MARTCSLFNIPYNLESICGVSIAGDTVNFSMNLISRIDIKCILYYHDNLDFVITLLRYSQQNIGYVCNILN